MSDTQPEHRIVHDPLALMMAIRWENIRRIADELDIAAAEVGSPYWVTQARALHDRAVFEEEALKGIAMP